MEKIKRPEWAEEGKEGFSTQVTPGVEGGHDGRPALNGVCPRPPRKFPKRRALSVDDYVNGVLCQDRTILGRAITLVESNAPAHLDLAQEMLRQLLPYTGKAMRVGITGVPGAGKSTFIEFFGNLLCDQDHRIAVLTVDPSSSLTRGSILGDKTRMETLARRPEAFIRPSPSGGTLGGVARKSRETMLVCEAAGFDVILVETVGVGQSEATVRSMVDFFLLVLIAGAGDELQGIKRGIIELTDTILVNKADGDNKPKALAAKMEFDRVLPYLQPATEGWKTRAHACSALNGEGVAEVWDIIREFKDLTTASGVLTKRRRRQSIEWMHAMIQEYLASSFFKDRGVKEILAQVEQNVAQGRISPTSAVQQLVGRYEARRSEIREKK